MDNIARNFEEIESTEAAFNGLREAELELTDAQLELIYGGCAGSCPFSKSDGDGDDSGWW